jgi:GNAT superfamily N-acetyltransferase
MPGLIRTATPEDISPISEWTRDTFPWGDYIPYVLERWIADETGRVFVGEVDGSVVAVGRVGMLGPDEAWAQGMRVHPEHRRQGHGLRITHALATWAEEQGAKVIRLSVETWNTSAQAQVAAAGFRPVSDWVHAVRAVGESSPVPEGNGGKRVPPAERLRVAHSAEADAAYMSWVGGELARAARNLFQIDWRWQRLSLEVLTEAARELGLLEGRPGWAIFEIDETEFLVHWIETGPSDARAMVLALIDKAAESGAETLGIMIPAVPWLERELKRLGFEPMHPNTVWARPL